MDNGDDMSDDMYDDMSDDGEAMQRAMQRSNNQIAKAIWQTYENYAVDFMNNVVAMMAGDGDAEIDHRRYPRSAKVKYDHKRAAYCIRSDYLGSVPRFDGKEFQTMFRLSRSRFQRLMEDVGALQDPFYTKIVDTTGHVGASFEARLMLPLKTMAYGVPPHCFRDYFQMSKTLANACCHKFYHIIRSTYSEEYLRLPTEEDLRNVVALHNSVHGVNGMFGSLDCMHTWWKNCPTAWKGQFKSGRDKHCTIVLEAACDHHLWFWHAAYGYAGTLNDINILNMSPLMTRILDGTFEELEQSLIPYKIGDEEFRQVFLLVDGIYPPLSRFVKAIKCPISDDQKGFTSWQESARKDIERAFGVLQCQWQCTSRAIYIMKMESIAAMMAALLILHNMGVSDRVMEGDVRARYNPANSLDEDNTDENDIRQPYDLRMRQEVTHTTANAATTHVSGNNDVYNLVTRRTRWEAPHDEEARERWDRLYDREENRRLTTAIKDWVH